METLSTIVTRAGMKQRSSEIQPQAGSVSDPTRRHKRSQSDVGAAEEKITAPNVAAILPRTREHDSNSAPPMIDRTARPGYGQPDHCDVNAEMTANAAR
jgi:hypothetical protein